MKKTLLVGLDAACWEYLTPLLQAGAMPCLQSLMDSGTWGTLHSTVPAWTPTAWASICTGKNPGKHGIYDMLWRHPSTGELLPISASMRRGTPFWKRLNDYQVCVGLVNVPFNYPLEQLEGFAVCGFGTPDSARDLTYPAALLSVIEEQVGQYHPAVAAHVLATAPPYTIFQVEREHQKRQVQIALDLARHDPVDVLVINLMLTDHANHKLPEMDQVQEAYRHSDADIATLIDQFQPDNVMLFSDHGSSRVRGNFLLGAWLRDHGYYVEVAHDTRKRAAVLNWILAQWLQGYHGWTGHQEKVLRRLTRELLLRSPEVLTRRLWDQIEELFPFARDNVRYTDRPDYAHTRILPGSIYSGLLYLNQRSESMQQDKTNIGTNSDTQQATLASKLIAELMEIKRPEGSSPLFSQIYTSDELYIGPATAYAPDIILDSYDSGWNIQATQLRVRPQSRLGRYFAVPSRNRDFGWHSRDGIFVFSGTDFSRGHGSSVSHVFDLPATLLHLYNIPIPNDYDGRPLTETMSPALRAQPVGHQPGDTLMAANGSYSLSQGEAAQLVNQLRALGYLE